MFPSFERLITPVEACDHSFRDACIFGAKGEMLAIVARAFYQEELLPEIMQQINQRFGSEVTIIVSRFSLDNLTLSS